MTTNGTITLSLLMVCGLVSMALANPKTDVSPNQLLGVWSGKGELKQKEVDMVLEGRKHFKSLSQVEDEVVWTYIYKEITRVPLVFSIRLESTWRIQSGYLCERMTAFSVSLVSKPSSDILPSMMVAKIMEGLQQQFKDHRDAKREHCNAVRIASPRQFQLKDGASSMITKFSRIN